MVGMSTTNLYGKIRAHEFPAPVKFSHRCVRWPLSAVQSWIAAQIEPGANGERGEATKRTGAHND